jgi:hypothetical protein
VTTTKVFVADLTPGSYVVSVSSSGATRTVTIAASGAGTTVATSARGLLAFTIQNGAVQ